MSDQFRVGFPTLPELSDPGFRDALQRDIDDLSVGLGSALNRRQQPWIVIGSGVGIAPAWIGAWGPVGGGTPAPAFFKDTLGFVHLRGRVTGGANGTNVFTLPVGYRPDATAAGDTYACAGYNNGAGVPVAALVYIVGGVLSVFYAAGGNDFGLGGLSFLAGA